MPGEVVPPDPAKVAKLIAERSGAVIELHGAAAAQRVGLSTQVPMQTTFLTSGTSKVIQVGSHVVQLKHAARRKLALAGTPAGIALISLCYLGKGEVKSETFEHIEHRILRSSSASW